MAEGGYIDVKRRVKGVLDELKDCSGELHEIESILTDARDGSSEERSDLLSTVREVLGALETSLTRVPEYEKSQEESSRSKRMRSGRSADAGICTHTCVLHPVIMNSGLWSKLTVDLVGVVFARLPIPRIMELRKSSEAWAALSDSASFRGAFAEANPKLFGVLGYVSDLEKFCTKILDATSKEWHETYLDFFDVYNYMGALHACDGGLVCFVPEWNNSEFYYPVFMCNPLKNTWRMLPQIWETFGYRDPVLVQLVTNELFYRVIVVHVDTQERPDAETFGASVYDSRTGSWSVMSSGLVYGSGNSIFSDRDGPLVFDCATKRLIKLNSCAALHDLEEQRSSYLKDRTFVLHALSNPDSPGDATKRFVISEFTYESSRSDLRKLNDYEVALRGPVGRDDVEIFTSTDFILVTWDYRSENVTVRQLIQIYDVSAGEWRDLPPWNGDPGNRNEELEGVLMCELRWDPVP